MAKLRFVVELGDVRILAVPSKTVPAKDYVFVVDTKTGNCKCECGSSKYHVPKQHGENVVQNVRGVCCKHGNDVREAFEAVGHFFPKPI